jgi:uncharacterized protein
MNGMHELFEATRMKYQRLQKILQDMGKVLVAYSGGVDSTLLLKVAADALGDKVLAVTALSATTPAHERQDAAEYARSMGVCHQEIQSYELNDPAFIKNPPNKCYICKKMRFGALVKMAAEEKLPWVVDGQNMDDDSDYRPGALAAKELGVRSPLREAGLSKQEIRLLSRGLGLASWDKPAYACLASRIPYGQTITAEKLWQVDAGETFLRELGLARQVRLRHEGDTARIEVESAAIGRFLAEEVRHPIAAHLRGLGFKYVALDLEGYSTGSLNRAIDTETNNQKDA